MTLRCSLHRGLRTVRAAATWSVGLTALALLVGLAAPSFAAPVLDGNIQDVVDQANTYISNGTGCGIIINDPQKDVCLSDPLIVPCTANLSTCATTGQYYVNGFDQVLAAVAVKGTDAWWGIRVVGQIGDTDGDGTDSKGSNCPPPGLGQNPEDGPGIAEGERYRFRVDTNCDGVTDIIITVSGGSGTHTPNVIITDGGGVTPIPGASGQAQYGTTDLEIHTTGLNLPPIFSVNTFVGSDFDGLSEDAAGPVKCNTPPVSLTIQKTVSKPTICPGDTDRFTITVNNTSSVDEVTNVRDVLPAGWTYADNISGDFAFNSQNGQIVSFGPLSVPAGQSRTVSFDVTSPTDCLGPYENKAVADAAFSSPCLAEPLTALSDTARATVTCDSKPCVTNVHCTAPEVACNGDQITVKGFADNCGDRPATITISINGHPHAFPNIPAGGTAEFDTTFQFACTPGQPTTWNVSATATNSCGTSAPGASTCSTNCATPPCVNNVSCSTPASACDGDQVTIKGFATNCGDRTEEIVITLSGPGGVIGSHAFNPAAGAVAEFDTTITFHCTGGQTSNFTASAVARNNCGVTQPVTSTGCSILCKTPPCVDNVSCQVPASACSNSPILLKGFAHNCGDRSEEITLTFRGPGGTTIGSHTFTVAAGGQAEFDTTITLNCTPGAGTTYTVTAVATNDCGTSAPVTSSGCTVQCLAGPCVDNVMCSTSASALCDGSSLKLTGNAHNCSDRSEQIVITLLGPNDVVLASRAFNVAAGATQSYDTTFTFNCTGTETKTYKVSAVATNDCGTSSPVASSGCPVTCKSPPCVSNVSCQVPSSACSGDQVTIKGFATNCGDRPGQIVITLSRGGAVLGSHAFGNVAAGAQAEFDTTITFNCTPGLATTFSASAIASNDCGTTQALTSSGCTIECKSAPCATVTCSAPPSATSGTPIQLSAIAHNCGDRPADLYVCILRNGTQVGCHWLRDVPGNTDARWDTTVTFECTGTETVNYSATVQAVNDCGTSNSVSSPSTCPVQCIQVGGSCPRTVGYWSAQCAQKGNGSTKYSASQVTAIAACIDARVDIFNWSDDFAGFCGVMTPPKPMDCKKQALRQFAGLLANACVGQLGFKASNGDSVHLELNDPNPCKSAFPNAQTMGDLVDAIDDQLVALENSGASSQDQRYCAIVECTDGINNGRGIPLDPKCAEGTSISAPTRLSGGQLGTDGAGLNVDGSNNVSVLELYRPTPNPFSNTTSFAYQVSGSAAQRVQIGIYDVAGRLVRELVNDTKTPGQYQTVWNGQDMGGSSVAHGVYFIRAYVGGLRVGDASRILYLR